MDEKPTILVSGISKMKVNTSLVIKTLEIIFKILNLAYLNHSVGFIPYVLFEQMWDLKKYHLLLPKVYLGVSLALIHILSHATNSCLTLIT